MVGFRCDGRTASGYLTEADGDGERAAIIVIHEWWGLNDHIKDIASRFAKEGYISLAPDLYDGKVTKDAEEAGRLMSSLDRDRALKTLNGAVEYLKGQGNVDGARIGVTGFCMGGTYALALPCHSTSIKAAAPFYGDIPSGEELRNLAAPVLFIGAENDFWITGDKMDYLRDTLARFGKDGEVKVYAGVGHAFFNDTRPEAYNKEASEDAWRCVVGFFATHLLQRI
jgi:carboxymethylenebutenolidase